ncbi:MAG: 16S rRNA (adenine(1518)-N(6)/adenine(1519)-N(6))-dimethyltransferase RsmA [Bacteroidota bacterium]
MKDVRPLKKFGQNYLTDKNILNKIVEEISPAAGDRIIEVGPGMGSLTHELVQRCSDVTAVEIDTRVIEHLAAQYPSLEIISGDFLKTSLDGLQRSPDSLLRVVGNIPYNITSPIVFKLIENSSIVSDAVFMVQYEVAKRMSAVKGTKDYGIFSIVLSFFAEVKFCFKVSPNVFYPRPNVDSAVVHIYFRKDRQPVSDEKLFIKTVKAAFGNRRKTLKNSLNNSIFTGINFENSGINLNLRAEQLDLTDFIRLTDYIYGVQHDRR